MNTQMNVQHTFYTSYLGYIMYFIGKVTGNIVDTDTLIVSKEVFEQLPCSQNQHSYIYENCVRENYNAKIKNVSQLREHFFNRHIVQNFCPYVQLLHLLVSRLLIRFLLPISL